MLWTGFSGMASNKPTDRPSDVALPEATGHPEAIQRNYVRASKKAWAFSPGKQTLENSVDTRGEAPSTANKFQKSKENHENPIKLPGKFARFFM